MQRCLGNTLDEYDKSCVGHLLYYESTPQRRVVRATFTAELCAGCDTLDVGLDVTQTLHEIHTGVATTPAARQLRASGGYAVPCVLYLDATSVYAAITATFVKTPAEAGLLGHLQHIRELLDNKVRNALAWTDTRDMYADGTTKGSIDRTALHQVMNGSIHVTQPVKLWRPNDRKQTTAVLTTTCWFLQSLD